MSTGVPWMRTPVGMPEDLLFLVPGYTDSGVGCAELNDKDADEVPPPAPGPGRPADVGNDATPAPGSEGSLADPAPDLDPDPDPVVVLPVLKGASEAGLIVTAGLPNGATAGDSRIDPSPGPRPMPMP